MAIPETQTSQFGGTAAQIEKNTNKVTSVDDNSTDTQYPSAKCLNTIKKAKVNTSDIVDDLTHTDTDKPLSAKQGKVLNEGKVNKTDITDNLTSTDTDKPLSAKQGKELNDSKENTSNKTTSLSANSTDTQYPSAKAVHDYAQAKESGKGLSTNDYDDTEKAKVASAVQPADLADVATSGSYSDLTDTPTIDSTYSPTSENAQSGVAVAQAVEQAASAIFDELTANDTSYDNTISGLNGETVQEAIDELSSSLDNLAGVTLKDVTSWAKVQEIVRAGLADKVFNIGDQFTVMKGTTPLVFDVIGIDHDTPADSQFRHSLTLQLHDCFTSLQFDATEALYYCESELAAGTYNFTLLSGYDPTYGGGKTLQFTLTNAVPAGGQIMFPWAYNTQSTATKISTYSSRTSTTAIETVDVTEGSGGTSLGTADGNTTNMNHSHRIRYGSNRYSQSAMRQWLNSNAVAGSVWTPQTNFDRPPTWVSNTAGFLNSMDQSFLAVLGDVTKTTALNTVTDGGGSETSTERMFLLSRSEVYGGNEVTGGEGNAYPFYSNYSALGSAGIGVDINRIKYRNGTAQYWWLRSPYSSNASYVRYVGPTGGIDCGGACNSSGVAPACCII